MLVQVLTVSKDLNPVRPLSHVRPARGDVSMLFNMLLQFERCVSFIRLHQNIRTDDFQEVSSFLIGDTPSKKWPMFRVGADASIVKVAAKAVVKRLNSWVVAHIHTGRDVIASVIASLLLEDVNEAFAIKNTSGVVQVHLGLQAGTGMTANSVKNPCPARKGAEGQYRAKQAALPPGVCNEHVLSTEVKMCSELHGNMKKLAEMTSSVGVTVHQQVTDCNTKYIHWRPHARRNMVPLDPDRFSVNQDAMIRLIGWAGSCEPAEGVTLH